MKKSISVIHLGHSHLSAMIPALYTRPVQTGEDTPITHYLFNASKHNIFSSDATKFSFGLTIDGELQINPEVQQMIDEVVPVDSHHIYLSMMGGNTHNVLMLLSPDRKFDFFLPGEVNLPFAENAEIIPYNAIKALISTVMAQNLDDLRAMKASFGKDVYHLLSPPPIADDQYVKSVVQQDPYFAAMAATHEVTSSPTRYKAWKTHCAIWSEVCEEAGIGVLSPPPSAVIDGHWLAQQYAGNDPTHGNYAYGEEVLKHVEASFDGHYAGYQFLS